VRQQLKLQSLSVSYSPILGNAQAEAYKENTGKTWDKPYDPQFGYSPQTKEGKETLKNATLGWEQKLPPRKKPRKGSKK
jgi:hypothetical protein